MFDLVVSSNCLVLWNQLIAGSRNAIQVKIIRLSKPRVEPCHSVAFLGFFYEENE